MEDYLPNIYTPVAFFWNCWNADNGQENKYYNCRHFAFDNTQRRTALTQSRVSEWSWNKLKHISFWLFSVKEIISWYDWVFLAGSKVYSRGICCRKRVCGTERDVRLSVLIMAQAVRRRAWHYHFVWIQ